MTYSPNEADLEKPDMAMMKTMAENARRAMGRMDIEPVDIAILASNGADNQPPHTDVEHLEMKFNCAGSGDIY